MSPFFRYISDCSENSISFTTIWLLLFFYIFFQKPHFRLVKIIRFVHHVIPSKMRIFAWWYFIWKQFMDFRQFFEKIKNPDDKGQYGGFIFYWFLRYLCHEGKNQDQSYTSLLNSVQNCFLNVMICRYFRQIKLEYLISHSLIKHPTAVASSMSDL